MVGFSSRRWWLVITLAASVGLIHCSSSTPQEGPDAQAPGLDGSAEGSRSADTGSALDAGPDTHEAAADSDACTGCNPPPPPLAPPTFTPPGPMPGGAAIVAGSTITIDAAAGSPAGMQIFFTLDGSIPVPPGGTLYTGAPLQITFFYGIQETVTAVAHDPTGGHEDSPPARALYVESDECGGCGAPITFSQQSSTQNNDFPLGLSYTPGANICYSVDGVTTPTCTTAGTCVPPALTYDQILQINGTMPPNPATGAVTVTALACEAGYPANGPVSQTFVLQVAEPTMTLAGNLVPSTTGATVLWPTGGGGVAPTLQTATVDSIVVSDPVRLWYTLGTGSPPTCGTGNGGVGLPSPTTFGSATAPAVAPLQSDSQTYQVIGCKHGYLPSSVVTFPVAIQLHTPVLAPATTPYDDVLDLAGTAGAAGTGIDDSANAGAPGEILCATTDGTPATCTAGASGTVSCAGTGSAPTSLVIQKSGTTVNLVACAPGLTASVPASATYTLQLDAGP